MVNKFTEEVRRTMGVHLFVMAGYNSGDGHVNKAK
jgi:hypothetical protein